ncbi:hypothetical protein BHE90_017422, partial [Fusarium euwallaceae]
LFKRVDNISGTLRFDFSRDIFAALRKYPPVIIFLTASMRARERELVGSDKVTMSGHPRRLGYNPPSVIQESWVQGMRPKSRFRY